MLVRAHTASARGSRHDAWIRDLAATLGCLLALASGALTAELTHASRASSDSAAQPAEGTVEGLVPRGIVADGLASAESRPASDRDPRQSPNLVSAPSVPAAPRSSEPTVLDEPARFNCGDSTCSNLRGGRIITGATRHRWILFTFDDGPDARHTRELLDHLDEADVRALFFVTTRRFQGDSPYARHLAAIVREIAARGHHVGTHSMDHVQLPLVSTPSLQQQVDASADLVARELGALPALLRPPGGSRSPRVDGYLTSRGYTQVLWNLGTGDVVVRSPAEVLATFRRVLEVRERDHGERGGIVLLHDIHAWSVAAFPRIVAWLDRRNCDLLDRGEELYDFVDDPALFYEPRRPSDAPGTEARVDTPDDFLAVRQIRARARAETRCADIAALEARIAGR